MDKSIQVVAFDCDGVMFDSRRANMCYYNEILDHFSRKAMTPEQCQLAHMGTVDETLAALFADPHELRAVHNFRRSMDYRKFIPMMQIEPQLKPLLKWLRPRRKCAIATNRTDTMEHVLKAHGLEDCFDFVICASDVDRPKPYPDELLKIITHFGVKAAEVLYIGDSEVDLLAARSAGMPLAAYKNRALDANYHIRSLATIRDLLET